MENLEEIKKRLSDELCQLPDDASVGCAEDILEKYGKVKECDDGIDDGIDDEDCEDEYIMYESFDIQTNFGDIHVILYYGNNSFVFSDFEIWWQNGIGYAKEKKVPFDNVKEHYEDYEAYLKKLQKACDKMPF